MRYCTVLAFDYIQYMANERERGLADELRSLRFTMAEALRTRDYLAMAIAAIFLGVIGPLGPFAPPMANAPLPKSGAKAAKMLPMALAAAEDRHGVKVRASLFNAQLEEVYGYNNEGVPAMMAPIARAKARAYLKGDTLGNPSVIATTFVYMLPWVFGFTNLPLQGSVKIMLPGLKEAAVFVVNGAPNAAVDLAIAQEVLLACGFKQKKGSDVWVL